MRMQGIVLLGAFLKLTPYAKESDMSEEHVYAGRREGAAQSISASAAIASCRTT